MGYWSGGRGGAALWMTGWRSRLCRCPQCTVSSVFTCVCVCVCVGRWLTGGCVCPVLLVARCPSVIGAAAGL